MKTNPHECATGYGFTTANGESHVNELGLTKREYFAAMAMQGRVANDYHSPETDFIGMALDCVKCADALIEALNK